MNELLILLGLVAILIFLMLSIYQMLLVLNVDLGKPIPAYGGRYDELPRNVKMMSLVAIGIFIIASILILVRTGFITNFPFPDLAAIGILIFGLFLALNTLGNVTSKSQKEKMIMTPLSLIACICCLLVALL
ncbi:MAG: hypothetical protein JSW11_18250 [Candidatus Heimdallarchaeota archaeon]|nr:MAG: hypothetical protein JSW11_18250 [Candidatus Heimdallarchaeota archaeon]